MPTYDYKCQACGKSQELFLEMKEASMLYTKKKCECGSNQLYKQFHAAPGIAFKGAGFFVNDYKDKK